MSTNKRQLLNSNKNKVLVLVYGLIVAVILLVVLLLMIFQVVNWSWLAGCLVGMMASAIGLILINKSWTVLLKTENHYLYLLFLVIRLGIYLLPFLLAFFVIDGQAFNVFGVLIGFIPLLIYPWVISLNKKINDTSNEE